VGGSVSFADGADVTRWHRIVPAKNSVSGSCAAKLDAVVEVVRDLGFCPGCRSACHLVEQSKVLLC